MKKSQINFRKTRRLIVSALMVIFVLGVFSCKSSNQLIEFEGYKIEKGVYIANPGWHFSEQGDGTFVAMKANDDISDSGGKIEPCDCALTTGGSCDQVTVEDDNGGISEIWCISNGCGFCVGGTSVAGQDGVLKQVRIKLDKVRNRKVHRN